MGNLSFTVVLIHTIALGGKRNNIKRARLATQQIRYSYGYDNVWKLIEIYKYNWFFKPIPVWDFKSLAEINYSGRIRCVFIKFLDYLWWKWTIIVFITKGTKRYSIFETIYSTKNCLKLFIYTSLSLANILELKKNRQIKSHLKNKHHKVWTHNLCKTFLLALIDYESSFNVVAEFDWYMWYHMLKP